MESERPGTPGAVSREPVEGPGEKARDGYAGVLSAAWALAGVLMLFLLAIFRLGRRGLATLERGLTPLEWTALVLLTAGFVWGEGRGALQMRWIPRLIRQAAALRRNGRPSHRVLAPLYGMSLVGGSRESRITAWGTSAAIVAAVILVRHFPEPWRGITDLAVVAALIWGAGAIVVQGPGAFRE